MARFNLRFAADTVRHAAGRTIPTTSTALVAATGLERRRGRRTGTRAADAMYVPYDEELGIHPQDDAFLDHEPWDWEGTPDRQVPAAAQLPPAGDLPPPGAQAGRRRAGDVPAQRRDFAADQKRRNFDYYDPITTGDSSLSACVQAIMAAEVGHAELALDYFRESLYLDIADTHGNTVDGAHIANVGGVWAGLVHGFAGMVDTVTTSSSRPACRPRGTASRSISAATARRCGSTSTRTVHAHRRRRPRGADLRRRELIVVTPDSPYVIAVDR